MGSPLALSSTTLGVAEGEPVEADDALARGLRRVPRRSIARRRSRVACRIEADIPGQVDVRRLDQRLDLDLDREQMRDPARDHFAERGEPAPAGGEIERHVEQVAALPVALGIVVVEHVDLARGRQAEHGDERRDRLRSRARDRLLVGGDQRALVHRQPLRPEEQLRRAQHEDVLAAVEHVAQDHVHELIDEQRRRLAHAAAHELQIGASTVLWPTR